MAKVKIYELAKQIDVESKEIIKRLQKMGVDAKNHMSTISQKDADAVIAALAAAGKGKIPAGKDVFVPKVTRIPKATIVKEQAPNEDIKAPMDTDVATATTTPTVTTMESEPAEKLDSPSPRKETIASAETVEARKAPLTELESPPVPESVKGKESVQLEHPSTFMPEQLEDARKRNPVEETAAVLEPSKTEEPKPTALVQEERSSRDEKSARGEKDRPEREARGEKDARPEREARGEKDRPEREARGEKDRPEHEARSEMDAHSEKDTRSANRSNDRFHQNGSRTEGRPAGQNRDSRSPRDGQNRGRNEGGRSQSGERSQGGARPQGGTRPYGQRDSRQQSNERVSIADRPQGGGRSQGGNRPARSGAPKLPPPQEKPNSNYRPNNNKKVFTKDMVFEKVSAEEGRLNKNKFNTKPGKGKNAKNQRKEAKVVMPPVTPKKITIGETVVLGELAKTMGKTASEIIKKLFTMGILATINQELDADTAILVADEFGVTVEVKADRAAEIMEDIVDDEQAMVERPPVVTIMGHVDHGKTSLLDAIRHTNVVSGEAGGITQHIGAYQVEINGKKITFLDTPGHEAFTAMRARGAQMTDIAVIVVAADDGVMPQTVEAINHSKAAGVPIIIAINKIDKPGANPDRVKQELTEYGLVGEEWGGDTIMVPVSAKARQNIEGLLEMILLVAEVEELKANPDRQARGAIVEAKLDRNRGPVATLLVQKGTLRDGDNILAGAVFGKVRAMHDDKGRKVRAAGPSMPVEVLGFSEVPPAGEIFMVVKDERDARLVAAKQQAKKREEELHKSSRVSLDDLFKQIEEGDIKELNIVVKADVQGSVEALTQSLLKLSTGEVRVNVIHSGVGGVSESDVMLAAASNAIIIGFNVIAPPAARASAEAEKVDIRLYRVIYDCLEDVKKAMSGLLAPEYREQIIGNVDVRTTFKVPKVGTIAGCYVTNGKVNRNAQVRVIRDNVVIAEDKISSLKRFKDDAKEVVQGFECGIGLENFNDLKEGDHFEVFIMEEIAREI